jgi:YgiT-type zinc finger domain-containing protein
MTTMCYFCKGKVVEQFTSVDFWWGEDLKIIENVPTGVCQQCGEKYFEGNVYHEMERLAKGEGQAVRRLSVDVMRYSPA